MISPIMLPLFWVTVAAAIASPLVIPVWRRGLQAVTGLVLGGFVVAVVERLRSEDDYFNTPGRLYWHSFRDSEQRAWMIGILALAGLWAVALMAAAVRARGAARLSALVIGAPIVAFVVLGVYIVHAAH